MSEDPRTILDASALLAYLNGEEGAETVSDALARGCVISSVNWAEVLSKVEEAGHSARDLVEALKERQLLEIALQIEPFDEADALAAGEWRPRSKHLGLSLGDRACLALGERFRRPIWTADRVWEDIDGLRGLEIRLVR